MTRARTILLLCLGLAAALVAPAGAGAHSIVRVQGSELSYQSADATSLNSLTIDPAGTEIHIRDPTVDNGMDQGTCRPGDVDSSGNPIEAFCPAAGIRTLRVDVGEREDKATITVNLATSLIGGGGADTLQTADADDVVVGGDGNDSLTAGGGADHLSAGDGDDTLDAGTGNDIIQAGLGVDTVDAGAGDDEVRVRDGQADHVTCGDGNDKVDADQFDEVGADCEAVTRTSDEPPAAGPTGSSGGGAGGGSTAAAADKVAPRLAVGGLTVQHVRRSSTLRVLATASERGTIAASGFLDVAGLLLPVLAKAVKVDVPGGGVELRITLTARQRRQVLASLRKSKRVFVRLGVVATDVAGNSVKRSAPRILLKR